ncbi:uncharacterized protein LOC129942694 [Eupeodes corollae]|uniref:uncharacterized protein LOC129942694 n=1 Tax=Eupeodes corollae TaxID=290404 RepID=UPI00249292B8|nr:uncharacterized protein LOC129942694 [Eupeodes corollae]
MLMVLENNMQNQTLIRHTPPPPTPPPTFDKQSTCVSLDIVPFASFSMSSPAVPSAAALGMGITSLPQRRRRRAQLYRDWHGTRPIDRVVVVIVRALAKRLLMMTSAVASSSSTTLIAFLPILLLVLCVVAAEVADVVVIGEIDGLTPEDVRFATLRCQNDSTDDPAMRLQWSLRMFPDNHETHCYVKCLLSKLGLINLEYRGLDGQKFIQPLENQDIDISDECFSHLDDKLSGTCESYYRKWMDMRAACKEFFYISLFEDPREVDKFNKMNVTQSKNFGETASEFCSKDITLSESRELTSEQTLGDDILSIFKCELACIFRHIRYFDIYGRIDKNEIIRSFKEANSDSKANLQVISKCAHRSNSLYPFGPCQMAYELYQCFIKKVKNFKEIYAQRDKISRYF